MKRRTIGSIWVAPVLLLQAWTASAQPPITTDAPFQIRYAANLQGGESYVNIINTGYNGDPLLGPGYGAAPGLGNICVNAYVLSSDEQLQACCSCRITPNQIVNLRVIADLLVRPLTPGGGMIGGGGGGASIQGHIGPINCGGGKQFADAAGNAQISPVDVLCPQFGSMSAPAPAGTTLLTKITILFQNDFQLGDPATAPNSWTFHWTNVPVDFIVAGHVDLNVTGGLTVDNALSMSSFTAQTSDALIFPSFTGSLGVHVATLSTTNNSGRLTPLNGSLGANAYITYDYLQLIAPTPSTDSVTLKLVGSLPGVGGTPLDCSNSAALVSPANVSGGYAAFGTTLHLTPFAGVYATTETRFVPASLNTMGLPGANDELHSLAGRCASILGNGSGYGICNSCRVGALGATKM